MVDTKINTTLSELLSSVLGKGAAMIAAAIVAALGFWLSPVKDILLQKLYPESALITVTPDRSRIYRGQSIQLDIEIAQKSTFPIGQGVLRLHFDPDVLVPEPNQPIEVTVPEIKGVFALPRPFVLFLKSDAVSNTKVSATFDTKAGHYSTKEASIGITHVEVVTPFIEKAGESAINLSGIWHLASGIWHLDLGGLTGSMTIKQDAANNITGVYQLELPSGEFIQSSVNGYKDGTSFKVFFLRHDAVPQR
jgi:hypothetical protein